MWGHIRGVLGAARRSAARRPTVATVLAAIALLIAVGAPGYAAQAVRSVFFAAHAGNAERVDGLKASRRPHPNRLLALNSKGKFPASVGVAGPRGAQGVPGTPGAPGTPGTALAESVILYEPPDEGGPPQWRIDDALSKRLDNDVNFAHPAPGVFCVHGLPSSITVMNAVATPGAFGASGQFLSQVDVARSGHSIGSGCPANTAAAIYISSPTSGQLEDPPDSSDTVYFELN